MITSRSQKQLELLYGYGMMTHYSCVPTIIMLTVLPLKKKESDDYCTCTELLVQNYKALGEFSLPWGHPKQDRPKDERPTLNTRDDNTDDSR